MSDVQGKMKAFPEATGSDPVPFAANFNALEQKTREHFVAVEQVKIAREAVVKCYRENTTNHIHACEEYTSKYYRMITDANKGRLSPSE